MESAVSEKKKSPAGGPPCWKGKKIHPTKPTKMKGGKRVNNCIDAGTNEEVELDEATDFRKGDTVHEVGSKLKGTVLHKGNRDEVVVKFGSINKSIPASQLRLVDELDEADVCPQCGSADCTCKPGECDCEPVKEKNMNLTDLRKLAGLSEANDTESCKACSGRGHKPAAGDMDRDCEKCNGTGKVAKENVAESYPMDAYGVQGDSEDTTDVNYSRTKRMGDASVTVSANAKSMDELHKVLALAGLDPSAADKYAEPESTIDHDHEVSVVEPDSDCGYDGSDDMSYSTDKQALIDMLKQKMQGRIG